MRRRIQRCHSRNHNSNRTRSISISISLALTRSLTLIRGLSRTPTLTLTLGATSRFAVLPAVLPPLDAARLLAEASTLAFDTRPDSVDREPAHELYLVRDGAVQPDARGLHALTKPSVAWLTQLVNQLHPELCAGQCAACTSLVRRYRPGERRGHHEHIDGHAAVTAYGV